MNDDNTWIPPTADAKEVEVTQRQSSSEAATPTSTTGARFAAGQLIGNRYRIVTKLGAGGMGEVYRAEDTRLGQEVALKFLPARLSRDASLLERLHSEVRIGRTISHPNVCRIYDIGEADGHFFIAMEYVSGDNLATLLKRIGRIPGDKAVEIARGLCAGLAAAHARGILHRDLKPANVMLDAEGDVRVADFGLAVESAAAGDEGVLVGTPAYMAPEQLRGEAATAQSDIYSLGLVLYEIFTGKRVNAGKSIAEIRDRSDSRAITTPSSIVADIDPAIEGLILRCLDPDPAERPRSVRELVLAMPGGDPLAAALAAGETPSPELVAAAGKQEGLRPAMAWSLLIGVVSLYSYLQWIAGYTDLHRRVEMRDPDTLRQISRDLLARAAGRPERVLSSEGFIQQPLVANYYRQEGTPGWRHDAAKLSQVTEFWYIEYPLESRPETDGGVLFVSEETPLPPGASLVRLGVTGALHEFRHAPSVRTNSRVAPADWTQLLEATRATATAPKEPTLFPPYTHDQRAAWSATLEGRRVTIEAASFNGRPTWFKVVEPWAIKDVEQSGPEFGGPLFETLVGALAVTLLLFAGSLAWANVKRGRGDLAGTLRLAIFTAVAGFVGFLLVADHSNSAAVEFRLVGEAFVDSAGVAVFVSILYLGVEPVIRRRWPELLITWSRLLRGRVRDPLVGRDVLIGLLAGVAHIAFVVTLHKLAESENLIRHSIPVSVRLTLASLLGSLSNGVVQGFISVMLLVVILLFVKNRRIAMAIYFVIVTAIFTAAFGGSAIPILSAVVTGALLLYVTITGGPIGFAVMQGVYLFLLRVPAGASQDWQWPIAITSALYIASLALFGFITALGSNRALRLNVFDD